MSDISDIILTTAGYEEGRPDPNGDPIAYLNAWLLETHHEPNAFRQVNAHAGGKRSMNNNVYLAGINHLDADGLLKAFRDAPWNEPECVQLMLKKEEDNLYTMYSLQVAENP